MPQIASLPMYNWPQLHQQTNQWWQVLVRNFVAGGLHRVPEKLNGNNDPHKDWHHSQLFLSQTCGYPLRYELRDVVEVVAVPRYSAEGCEGSNYSSMVVVGKEDSHKSLSDFYDRRAAFNAENSQSGYSSLRAVIAPLARGGRFFASTIKTGAHLKSMAAVAEKRADICAIDCVSWGLAKRLFPELVSSLGVIGQTPFAPSLPYVTTATCSKDDLQIMRNALLKAGEDEEHKELRAQLLLDGFEILQQSSYERIDEIENSAIQTGYPKLY